MASGQAWDQGPRDCWGDLRVGPAGGRSTPSDASRRLARMGRDRAPGPRGRRSSRGSGLGCRVYGVRARPFAGEGRGVGGLGDRTWRPIVLAAVCPAPGDTAEVGEERQQGRFRHVTNYTPEASGGTRKRHFLRVPSDAKTAREVAIVDVWGWARDTQTAQGIRISRA